MADGAAAIAAAARPGRSRRHSASGRHQGSPWRGDDRPGVGRSGSPTDRRITSSPQDWRSRARRWMSQAAASAPARPTTRDAYRIDYPAEAAGAARIQAPLDRSCRAKLSKRHAIPDQLLAAQGLPGSSGCQQRPQLRANLGPGRVRHRQLERGCWSQHADLQGRFPAPALGRCFRRRRTSVFGSRDSGSVGKSSPCWSQTNPNSATATAQSRSSASAAQPEAPTTSA